jgi:hypothetical protein
MISETYLENFAVGMLKSLLTKLQTDVCNLLFHLVQKENRNPLSGSLDC